MIMWKKLFRHILAVNCMAPALYISFRSITYFHATKPLICTLESVLVIGVYMYCAFLFLKKYPLDSFLILCIVILPFVSVLYFYILHAGICVDVL